MQSEFPLSLRREQLMTRGPPHSLEQTKPEGTLEQDAQHQEEAHAIHATDGAENKRTGNQKEKNRYSIG